MSPDGGSAVAPHGGERSATAVLWAHRDRRIPAVAALVALTGRSPALVADAARIDFALSIELEVLLGTMSERMRGLPSVLVGEPERMAHSVRGPVMWSETMTARANSFGSDDVYVCRTVRRDFDCAANRLLVWLLERAASCGRLLRSPRRGAAVTALIDAGTIRRAEEVGAAARDWRRSARLAAVPGSLPDRLELKRIRQSRRPGGEVEVLLAARRRALQPFEPEDAAALTDRVTAKEHEQVLESFLRRGGEDFVFSCSERTLAVGDVRWRHRNHAGGVVQPADS